MGLPIKLTVGRAGERGETVGELEFDQDHIGIGRAERNEVALPDVDKRVSNRHARIEREGGAYFAIDLASTNGTYLDGRRIEPQRRVQLRDGMLLELGAFEISVSIPVAEPAEPAGAREAPVLGAPAASADEAAALEALRSLARRFLGREDLAGAESIERFRERIEHALAASFEWVSRSLQGRAEFKSRFSADVTMMFELGANPIKSAADAEAIGKYVLDWSGEAPGEQVQTALDDAYRDLTLHQLGLLAGVQDCMKSVLSRMAPEALESALGPKAKGMGAAKRLWQEFAKVHGEIFEDTSRMFSEVIYPSLRKGYLTAHAALESEPAGPTGEDGGAHSKAEEVGDDG